MAAHTTTLTGTFGLNGTNPNSLTLKVIFTESVVNGWGAVSEVTAQVEIINANDGKERRYTYTDAKVQIGVFDTATGNWNYQYIGPANARFSVASGKTVVLGTRKFASVPNNTGTTNVKVTGFWTTGSAGHGNPVLASTPLTLTSNQAAHPCTPLMYTNTVLSSGAGTTALLTWTNRENVNGETRNNVPVVINAPYTSLQILYWESPVAPTVRMAPKTIALTGGTGNWPSSYSVTGLDPGKKYYFQIQAGNSLGLAGSYQVPLLMNGAATGTGTSDSGSNQESSSILGPSGVINYAVGATSVNGLNASATVVAKPGGTQDMGTDSAVLAKATPGPVQTLVNYCGDPRMYWQNAVGGNTTLSPYTNNINRADITSLPARPLPQGMTNALIVLGYAAVDRCAQTSYLANTSNATGGTVFPYIFLSGSPDASPLSNTQSYPVPANSTSVGFSCYAYANSAASNTTRGMPNLKFVATYQNGTVIATNTVAQSAAAVNTLVTLSGQWTLPANTARVAMALESSTAQGAAWTGGYLTGESQSFTAFMVGFNAEASQWPYFDGATPSAGVRIVNGGDLGGGYALTSILNTIGYGGNLPTIP